MTASAGYVWTAWKLPQCQQKRFISAVKVVCPSYMPTARMLLSVSRESPSQKSTVVASDMVEAVLEFVGLLLIHRGHIIATMSSARSTSASCKQISVHPPCTLWSVLSSDVDTQFSSFNRSSSFNACSTRSTSFSASLSFSFSLSCVSLFAFSQPFPCMIF